MLRARTRIGIVMAVIGLALSSAALSITPAAGSVAPESQSDRGVLDYDCGGEPGHRTGYLQPWGGCYQLTRNDVAAYLTTEMQWTPGCNIPVRTYDYGCFKADVQGGGGGYDAVGELIMVEDGNNDGMLVGVRWETFNLDPGQSEQRGICATDYPVMGNDGAVSICDLPNIPEGSDIRMKTGRCPSRCGLIQNWQNWGPVKSFHDDLDAESK